MEQDAAQKMDVYLPAGRTTENTKVVVFIHGGSWNGGDKADFNTAIPLLKNPTSGLCNLQYKLSPC